jgi:hypothetical protein
MSPPTLELRPAPSEKGPVGLLLAHRALSTYTSALNALADRAWSRIQEHRPSEVVNDDPEWLLVTTDSRLLLPLFEVPIFTCADLAETNVPGVDLERFENQRLVLSPLTRWSRFGNKGPLSQIPPLLAWLLGEIERRCEDPLRGGLVPLGWKITEAYVELHATVPDELARAVSDARGKKS